MKTLSSRSLALLALLSCILLTPGTPAQGYDGPGEVVPPPRPSPSPGPRTSSGTDGSGQDGKVCPPVEGDPADAAHVPGDAALIGAAPFDLGAILRGDLEPPAFAYDPASEVQGALLGNIFAPTPGFGTAFAFGNFGTVGAGSGTFEHPFTILSLPSDVPSMGLSVGLTYRAIPATPSNDWPFGPGFFLSGLDRLVVLAPVGGGQPVKVRIERGDGITATYNWTGSEWTSPGGILDHLDWIGGSQPRFQRYLNDGRRVEYTEVVPASGVYYRSKVENINAPGLPYIQYQYGSAGTGQSQPPISRITDSRGVDIVFTWQDVGGQTLRVTHVEIDPTTLDTQSLSPPLSPTGDELAVEFSYSNGRLYEIRYPPTTIAVDDDGDGQIVLPDDISSVRPTVRLEYNSQNLLYQISDATPGCPVQTRLYMIYDSSGRVIQQIEGNNAGTDPLHQFAWTDVPPQYLEYTDPRGTQTKVELDGSLRTWRVTMDATYLPRNANGDPFPDHTALTGLTWEIAYGCTCGQPSILETPKGDTYTFLWDDATGALTRLTVGPPGSQRVYQLEYTPHTVGTITSNYDLTKYTDPLGNEWTWEWQYNDDTTHEFELEQVTARTPTYTDVDGNARPSIATKYVLGLRGQLTSYTVADGTSDSLTTSITYKTGSGRYLPWRITVAPGPLAYITAYSIDDLGRIASIEEGEGSGIVTEYVSDVYFRSQIEKTPPLGSVSPAQITTQRWFDRRGNLTVERRDNRDDLGNLRPRAFVESQWIHDRFDRVVKERIDQAPLDAPAPDVLVTSYDYYPTHDLWKTTLPDGSVTVEDVDGYGFLYRTIFDSTGTTPFIPKHYYYDAEGRLEHVLGAIKTPQDPRYRRTDFSINVYGEVSAASDPENGRIEYQYDALGRLVEQVEKDEATSAVLRKTTWEYDALSRVTKQRRHVLESPGLFDDTKLRYNQRGQLIETELPLGRGDHREYDTAGRLVKVRDRIDGAGASGPGNEVEYEYEDITSRVHAILRKDAEATTFGPPTGAWPQKVQREELTYDLGSRVISRKMLREIGATTAPAEVVHTFGYDSFDYQVRYRDSNGAGVDWVFDSLGRQRVRTEVGTSGGTIQTKASYIWNATETRVERTDGMTPPRITNHLYDKAGRLIEVRHPGYLAPSTAHRNRFSYDVDGNVWKIHTGRDHEVQQVFDKNDRLRLRVLTAFNPSEQLSLAATAEELQYDALGRVTHAITYMGAPAEKLVDVTFAWDSLDRQLSEKFAYMPGWGTPPPHPPDRTVTSGYDFTGGQDFLWRRKITYPSGHVVDLTPDALGKVLDVALKPPGATTRSLARYRYAGNRPLERELYFGTGTSDHQDSVLTWDGQRRLEQLRTEKKSPSLTELWRWDYRMGSEGHLTQERYYVSGGFNQPASKYHEFDQYYSLKGTKIGVPLNDLDTKTWAQSAYDERYQYVLDKGHNRTTETIERFSAVYTTNYTVDSTIDAPSHRYLDVDGQDYAYDGEGNLTFDGAFQYRYDFKNRLSEVYRYLPGAGAAAMTAGAGLYKGVTTYEVDPKELDRLNQAADAAWATPEDVAKAIANAKGGAPSVTSGVATDGSYELVATYGYDPLNRRVWRWVAGQPQHFYVYDGDREVEEVSSSAPNALQEEKSFVWGRGIDELLCYSRKIDASWTQYYLHQDRLDSTHKVVDGNGTVIATYAYGPYGFLTLSGAATENPYLWAGRRLDLETGIYYFRNRYYSPQIGRFLTEDPLGAWEDTAHYGNPYAYAGNSPLCLLDVFGLQAGSVTVQISSSIPGSTPFQMEVLLPPQTGEWVVFAEFAEPLDVGGLIPVPIEGVRVDVTNGVDSAEVTNSFEYYDEIDTILSAAEFAFDNFSPGGKAKRVLQAKKELTKAEKAEKAARAAKAAAERAKKALENEKCNEHTKGQAPSKKDKHDRGQAAKKRSRGGEKGDEQRRFPNRRPAGWKGPWPPPKN